MHNGAHILAHLVAHLAAGDGTRIHQIVLDPDHLAVLLARLIVQNALHGGHVLAGNVLIHDDEIDVPDLTLLPQLVNNVLITAVRVTCA